MSTDFYLRYSCILRKAVSCFVALAFIVSFIAPICTAESLLNLPAVGQALELTEPFEPSVLKGMQVHFENPLLFDFIVDRGQERITDRQLKIESEQLVKYFLASMTIPDEQAWVNLSPYEKDRIIPDALGQTEMGRAMLEQDYVLKQLAASLTNPDTDLGKRFWDTVNERSVAVGARSIVPLENKVWIVPDGATVVEKDGFAYITESKLKVMMEEEYQAVGAYGNTPLKKNAGFSSVSSATQVFREMILPKLNEEVNRGKNFAAARQVYQSVILATWYKKTLKDSLLAKVYVDKSKVHGITTDITDIKEKVYHQYLQAFKKGVYNVIKEQDSPDGQTIPRKYFSGGLGLGASSLVLKVDQSIDAVVDSARSIIVNPRFSLVSVENTEGGISVVLLVVDAKEDWIRYFLDRLTSTEDDLLRQLREKSPWTYIHSRRVARIVLDIVTYLQQAGYPSLPVEDFVKAALFHDIGKLGVEFDVLEKQGALTQEERAQIMQHPIIGYDILVANNFHSEIILNAAIGHHERYNGMGYPYRRINGFNPLVARIVAVADVIDSLTANDRPYRTAAFVDEYIRILVENFKDDPLFKVLAPLHGIVLKENDSLPIPRFDLNLTDQPIWLSGQSSRLSPNIPTNDPVNEDKNLGGINFNPDLVNLQIKRDVDGVPLPVSQQDFENIDIQGLYPVIIDIMPVNIQSLPVLGQANLAAQAVLPKS